MIKLVVFDFDDTLSFTEEGFFHVENYIAQKLGFPPMTRETHQKNWGKPVREAIMERIPGIDPEKFMQLHKEVLPQFLRENKVDQVSKRNIEVLASLKREGKHVAILTSRSLQEAEHLLHKDHILRSVVERVYHEDNNLYKKPNPRAFDQILTDFGVLPSETVYIGDSISDGKAAKGAHIHFIALLERV